MRADPIGLYIHLPFCLKKCAYCDFCSYDGASSDEIAAYAEALIKEMYAYSKEPRINVDTVFFGGGTPSSVPALLIEKILSEARCVFDISEDAEITLEMNPGALGDGALDVYKCAGINRVSIGLQSIHENELKILGRIHTFDDFKQTYNAVRAAGISNVNVDLMYGIPEQTQDSFMQTLSAISDLDPEHLSVYSLILEPQTPLCEVSPLLDIPDDNTVADMYLACVGFLAQRGYAHYEISNYAKRGFECRHNLKYWRCREYIGLGIGAHSYFGGSRYGNSGDRKNRSSLSGYIASPTDFTAEAHRIAPKEEQSDYIMLALRLSEGIDQSDFEERFGCAFKSNRETYLDSLVKHGLAVDAGGRFYLTDKGMLVSNSIIAELI